PPVRLRLRRPPPPLAGALPVRRRPAALLPPPRRARADAQRGRPGHLRAHRRHRAGGRLAGLPATLAGRPRRPPDVPHPRRHRPRRRPRPLPRRGILAAVTPPSPPSRPAAEALRWGGLLVLLACATLRATVDLEPLPHWDLDPARVSAPVTGIG